MMISTRSSARLGLRTVLFCFGGFAAASVAVAELKPVPAFPRSDGPLAVAVRPASPDLPEAVAVGDVRGAWLSEAGAPARRLLLGDEVRDLAFSADGALWLATDDGLRRRAPDSTALTDHGPAPGGARRAASLASTAVGVFVGTEAGVHWVSPHASRRVDGVVPHGNVSGLAWDPERRVLHAVIDERLYAIAIPEGAGGDATTVHRVALPTGAGAPLDLASAPGGPLVLTPRGLLRVVGERVRRDAPPLPAGLRAIRVAASGERVWLVGPRGLHSWAGEGAWRSIARSGGRVPLTAVAVARGEVVAVGPRGVFRLVDRAAEQAAPGAGEHSGSPSVSREGRVRATPSPTSPPIGAVHRAVVRAHGLEPARGHRWRDRVARRGRLPELELRLGYGGSRAQARDYDEAFTSGALRRLNDHAADRDRDFDVQAVLRWDWGDAFHHPEEVDVAKEVREWTLLRDEILDEVSQLYFERQRVLAERARLGPGDPAARLLEIRAAELGAGLDAWTNGWWSQAAPGPKRSRPGPVENQE